jgi:ElaB/YqjD/DUF883 family membrane-anchored ribosome-binding protein
MSPAQEAAMQATISNASAGALTPAQSPDDMLPKGPPATPNVEHDFRRFVREVEQVLASAQSLSSEGMKLARSRLEDEVARAKCGLDAARSRAVAEMNVAVSATERYVRREPVRALAIAAGVGAIAALLLRR